MKDLAIYGFGGFGREIASIIHSINRVEPQWNIIGFFDDGVEPDKANRYGKVLGGLDTLNAWSTSLNVVMAIASPAILQKLTSAIHNPNVIYPNIIAPTVLFFDAGTVQMGQGNVLCHNCRVSCDVELGNFNLLNGAVSLGRTGPRRGRPADHDAEKARSICQTQGAAPERRQCQPQTRHRIAPLRKKRQA